MANTGILGEVNIFAEFGISIQIMLQLFTVVALSSFLAVMRPDRLFPALGRIHVPKPVFLALATVGGIAIYSYLLSFMNSNFITSAWDFGAFDHRAWSLGRFQFFSELEGAAPQFVPTFEPILAIPGWLFRIWDDAGVLILFEAIALGLGVVPLFLLANELLGSYISAVFLSLGYLFAMIVLNSMGVPVITTSWLPTAYFFAAYFAFRKQWKGYWVAIFVALLCKESAGAHLIALSIIVFVVFGEKRIAITTGIIGLVVFVFLNFYILPRVSEGFTGTAGVELEKRVTAVASLLHYIDGITYFFTSAGRYKLILLFASNGFIGLLNPITWITVPLSLLDTGAAQFASSYDFYSFPPALVFLFLGVIVTLTHLPKRLSGAVPISYVCFYVLLAVVIIYTKPRGERSPLLLVSNQTYTDRGLLDQNRDAVLAAIPGGVSVLTQEAIVPHLTHRERVGIFGRKPLEDYHYILLSNDYRIRSSPLKLDELLEKIEQLKRDSNYEVALENPSFVLLRRK